MTEEQKIMINEICGFLNEDRFDKIEEKKIPSKNNEQFSPDIYDFMFNFFNKIYEQAKMPLLKSKNELKLKIINNDENYYVISVNLSPTIFIFYNNNKKSKSYLIGINKQGMISFIFLFESLFDFDSLKQKKKSKKRPKMDEMIAIAVSEFLKENPHVLGEKYA